MKYLHDNEGYALAQENHAAYAEGLGSFSTLIDEKRVIADYVISQGSLGDVLDIGAGSGEVAKHLRDHSNRYVTIEQNPTLCSELADLGLEVVCGSFPSVPIEDTFDTVLASHSIPGRSDEYQPFIDAAVERVSALGRLVIVTLSDAPSAYTTIMNEIGLPREATGGYIRAIGDYARSKGQVREQEVVSVVKTPDINRVIAAIAFVGSTNGNLEKRRIISKSLQDTPDLLAPFHTDDGYTFPFVSYGITILPD